MKALTLCVLLGGTQLMRLFSASGVSLCLCEFLSFYFTLFTRLLMSLLLRLSGCTGRRRHARKQRPVAWSSSGLVPQGLFHSCDHYTFFSMLSWGNEFSFCQGILGKDTSFLDVYFTVLHRSFRFPTQRHWCAIYEEIPEQYSPVWGGAS